MFCFYIRLVKIIIKSTALYLDFADHNIIKYINLAIKMNQVNQTNQIKKKRKNLVNHAKAEKGTRQKLTVT